MKRLIVLGGLVTIIQLISATMASDSLAAMNDYCITPPFVNQTVPPLVMFEMERDNKLYFQAYNDATDLDGDGKVDSQYKHSINYYGYFDPFKCYTPPSGAGNSDLFTPVSVSSSKFCTAGQWSGNVLNWLTMTRMDILKKVLYGGQRAADSGTTTTLERVYVPQDAHSWGKELTGRLCYDGSSTYTYTCSKDADCDTGWTCANKSTELIGVAAADAQSACASSVAVPGTVAGKILVAKYNHPSHLGTCGDYSITTTDPPSDCPECPPTVVINDGIFDSYEASPANLLSYYTITGFDDTTATNNAIPEQDHGSNFNFFMVSDFNVTNSDKGDWQFVVDGDDGVELLIDGRIVSIYPGCHPRCYDVPAGRTPQAPATAKVCSGTILGPTVKGCNIAADCLAGEGSCVAGTPVCASTTYPIPQPGTISLSAGYHRLIVRHSENGGQDGVRVWFKKSATGAWTMFNSTNLTLRAPAITAANQCSISVKTFIETGDPAVGDAKRHLFCNTSLAANQSPILRYITNRSERIWQWASMESGVGPSCGSKIYNNATNDNFSATSNIAPTDLAVRVETCKPGITGAIYDPDYEFERCKDYEGTYKPIGLLQKYGETVNGAKVCSKSMSKSCSTDSDCTLATEGLCVYKSDMYYGLFTTSYTKNKSGGVLRKNIGSILDETNANNGIFQTSENTAGNMIHTIDRLKVVDFSGTSYGTNCSFNDRPMAEGECHDWGNPIAEMMYESLRYLAGKGSALTEFTYSSPADAGLSLSKPGWGKFGTGSSTYKPYDIYPPCAKPFILLLSDVNTSFDGDQLPGSAFNTSYTEDAALPKLNMNVSTLANTIGTQEGIAGNSWFIGETTTNNDFICDPKTVTNLSLIRGTCPEEPTKQGSFYTASVAYYGKTQFNTNTQLPNVNTFAVALSSPMADLKFKVGGKTITFVPVGKSVSGSSAAAQCYNKCTFNINNTATGHGLTISNCGAESFCPTNAIVNVFFEDSRYDASGNLTYARFRINYENYEQGNDFDMDALVRYEVCTSASVGQSYSYCTNTLTANQIEIKVDSRAAAGGTDQALGFAISGSTADGSYLVVKDADVGNTSPITTLPLTWQRIFDVSTTGTSAGILKNPLWYAAKWGGFEDSNGNNMPDAKQEWAKNCSDTDITKCDPDNYYLVNNPLELERQLDRALNDILQRTSSGTAASIVNNRGESGTNLLQAVFYPKKSYPNAGGEIVWSGELQNLWYYLDPFIKANTIREDTDSDNKLDLDQDDMVKVEFVTGENKTVASWFRDPIGLVPDNRTTTLIPFTSTPRGASGDPDSTWALWKAGEQLYFRTKPRVIKTTLDGTSLSSFSTANAASLESPLTVTADVSHTEATKVINYVTGIDGTGRSRKVVYGNSATASEWKLGDIVSSTPQVQPNAPLNSYYNDYLDGSYKLFIESNENTGNLDLSPKKYGRGMVYVGANDGMLHAFKLGTIKKLNPTSAHPHQVAQLKWNGDGDPNSPDTTRPVPGEEEWAYIPKNALPYLKYLADPTYNHLFYVDNSPILTDVSIGRTTSTTGYSCSASDYWNCEKKTTKDTTTYTDGSYDLNLSETSWKTVLLGGMGLGGASRDANGFCNKKDGSTPTSLAQQDRTDCVKSPVAGSGYSSYFALDVTNPTSPQLLWEFPDSAIASHAAALGKLGYTTPNAVVIRIASKRKVGGSVVGADNNRQGRWFAVFASGPTGAIETNTHQFLGASDQTLKVFVVDLKTGELVASIDSGIKNAFAGSLSASSVDIDKWNNNSTGYYSDDVVYIGYAQANADPVVPGTPGTAGVTTWTKGGVLRLAISDTYDPDNAPSTEFVAYGNSPTAGKNWILSKVIDGIGPVTTAVTKLQDRANKKMWLYFGTGRYFFKSLGVVDDFGGTTATDNTTTRQLFGIMEPCYNSDVSLTNTHLNDLDLGFCNGVEGHPTSMINPSTSISTPYSYLADQSTGSTKTLASGKKGWFIRLDPAGSYASGPDLKVSSFAAERIITDPLAALNGVVFFTSFRPTAEICGFGGDTLVWAVDYSTGSQAPQGALKGKAIVQTSTGSFMIIDLATAFTDREFRRIDPRLATKGAPPKNRGLGLVTRPQPTRKILHVQEK